MLVAKNITKAYKHPVLQDVSLSAAGGEIIGLAGENGSGKSTLLSVLTAVTRPDRGHVTVEGADVHRGPRTARRHLGYVPQENALFDNLSALDNLKLWASAYGTDWRNALPFLFPAFTKEESQRAFLKQKAGRLSGGMKKRLSIALALMHRPTYLLMDEPTAGLDIGFKGALAETLRTLRDEGRCVLFSSHQPDELLWCDRIYVLRGGVFVFDGEPSALRPHTGIGGLTDALLALITRDTADFARPL